VDGTSIDYTVSYNATHSFIYFEFAGEEVRIQVRGAEVIPEFPSFILAMLMLLMVVIIWKRKKKLNT
jgi:hypothetical protein